MKTYVLMVARQFPAYHKRAGEPTRFIEQYQDADKIHTLRENYELWKKRIDEVNEGIAVLSLRYWEGRPYHSDQIEFDRLGGNDVGIQKTILGECRLPKVFAANDGLSLEDFYDWFKNTSAIKPLAIIHFTSFRY